MKKQKYEMSVIKIPVLKDDKIKFRKLLKKYNFKTYYDFIDYIIEIDKNE
jgi:hypothetical protein